MPEGVPPPQRTVLTDGEIFRLADLLVRMGVDKLRLTGGEPLLHGGLPALLERLRAVEGLRTLALTSNGLLLPEQLPALVSAGLDGVNLSLDTLDRKQYAAITRVDALDRVLLGLRRALETESLRVKVNCVLLGENDAQLVPLAELAREEELAVRFIERMPLGDASGWRLRTEAQAREILEAAFGPARPAGGYGTDGPARYVRFEGFRGRVGFISPLSHPFCGGCDRLRLTSDGFLKTCLQYEDGVDLKALLDAGADDSALADAVREAVATKPPCHHFQGPRMEGDERRGMNEIGG